MNEKEFEIGQRVRIIGPTAADTNIHTGKCFVIEEAKGVQWKNGPFQYCVGYSEHGSIHAWPASSLELAESEYVTDGQMVEIGPIKKHNHSVTSISIDELLDRLDSIEKRLQALEDNAKEGTPSEEATEQPSIGPGDFPEELIGWNEMITFRYDDYGCGIIGKIWVGFDGPSGKFFQIIVPSLEDKARFVEELKSLDEMLPKNTTVLPQRVAERCARCGRE